MTNQIEKSLAGRVRAAFALPSRDEEQRGERLVREAAVVDLDSLEAHARGRLALSEGDVLKLEIFRAVRADALAWHDEGRPLALLLTLARRALRTEREAKSALLELRACGLSSELIDGARWFRTSDLARAAPQTKRISAWLATIANLPPVVIAERVSAPTEQKLDRIDDELLTDKAAVIDRFMKIGLKRADYSERPPPKLRSWDTVKRAIEKIGGELICEGQGSRSGTQAWASVVDRAAREYWPD